jgi:hypothetical protein
MPNLLAVWKAWIATFSIHNSSWQTFGLPPSVWFSTYSFYVILLLQASTVEQQKQHIALIAEASNLRETVHRLQMDKETSDTLMHGVLAMAGRDETSRKALEEEKARLITQLNYEMVRRM